MNNLFKVTPVVSEGDVGEDGMSKEEREKQRKRKAAERLREINKRKKTERVSQNINISMHIIKTHDSESRGQEEAGRTR